MEKNISAVVLTYNCYQPWLEACLKSLQKFPEIVAIDGGSTDETTLKTLHDFNAVIFKRPNIGPDNPIPRQNNYALRNVSHDYVFFLDTDETIDQNIYDKMLEHIQGDDAWICWIPRVTMANNTQFYKDFIPDPQAKFMRVGYAFWIDDGEEDLHQIPNCLDGINGNIHVYTENEYTIRHWGYVLSDDNVSRIREKYRWHSQLKSKATRNIFKMAEEAKLDPIDYLKTLQLEEMKFR